MKIRFCLLLWIAVGMVSCAPGQGEESPSAPAVASPAMPAPTIAPSDHPELLGYYIGYIRATRFVQGKKPDYDNYVNLSIDRIVGNKISGHSVFLGFARPFSGTCIEDGQNMRVSATEHGNRLDNGNLRFIVTPDHKIVKGTWSALDHTLSVTEGDYELSRAAFDYDAHLSLPESMSSAILYNQFPDPADDKIEMTTQDAIRFNASLVKLKAEDIENMYLGDLEIMRYAIYARHGYSFKDTDMRQTFEARVPWYIAVKADVSEDLTPLEKENIALIKRYENHASSNYSDFYR